MQVLKSNDSHREDGAKRSSFKMLTPESKDLYDKKGEKVPYVIALISELHNHCLKFHKPLKTIYLSEAYYNEFEFWSRSHMTEQQADIKILVYTWCGREIEKMGKHHIQRASTGTMNLDWDFYPATNG